MARCIKFSILLTRRRALPPLRLIVPLLLVAFFNNAVPFVLFPLGERAVPSNIAAVLNAKTQIWTLLLGLTFMGKKAEGGTIPGVVVGFLGVIPVVFSHTAAAASSFRHDYLLGIVFIAVASAAHAIVKVLANSKLAGLDSIGLATTQLRLESLMILPVSLFGAHPAVVKASSLAAAITLGVLGSGLAYLIFYSLLGRVSSTRVASVTSLGGIWGLFWGRLTHETITWSAYLGVGIVIAGLVPLSRTSAPAGKAAPLFAVPDEARDRSCVAGES